MIQRYTPTIPGSPDTAPVVPDSVGKFVRFEDYEHEVAGFARGLLALQIEINLLRARLRELATL